MFPGRGGCLRVRAETHAATENMRHILLGTWSLIYTLKIISGLHIIKCNKVMYLMLMFSNILKAHNL